MDLGPFAAPPTPLPGQTTALFVGVLESYKNIDGLAAAWRLARPNAELRIVGKGTRTDVVASLVSDGLATWQPELSTDEVVRMLNLRMANRGLSVAVLQERLATTP